MGVTQRYETSLESINSGALFNRKLSLKGRLTPEDISPLYLTKWSLGKRDLHKLYSFGLPTLNARRVATRPSTPKSEATKLYQSLKKVQTPKLLYKRASISKK